MSKPSPTPTNLQHIPTFSTHYFQPISIFWIYPHQCPTLYTPPKAVSTYSALSNCLFPFSLFFTLRSTPACSFIATPLPVSNLL